MKKINKLYCIVYAFSCAPDRGFHCFYPYEKILSRIQGNLMTVFPILHMEAKK